MVKKRRKLSKDYEKLISAASKEIELILAKINDIYDDDIKLEYLQEFTPIKITVKKLKSIYDEIGYTENSDENYQYYLSILNKFKEEYEI